MAAPGVAADLITHTRASGKKHRGVPLQNTLRPAPLTPTEFAVTLPDASAWRGRLIQPYPINPVQLPHDSLGWASRME
eukprot:6058653-Alexandrium_andersonii.AAC.1